MDDVTKFDFGKVVLEIVERPNVSLPVEYRETLVRECKPAARSAFRNEGVTDSDIEKHAMRVSTAIFVRDLNGNLAGFASSVRKQVRGREFVYLEATALRQEWQGKHLYTPLIALRVLLGGRRSSSTPLVTTRTQNPIVFKTMVNDFGLYPRLNEPTPDHLKNLAEAFAAVVRDEHSDWQSANGLNFDRDYLVVRRAYGRTLEGGREEGVCMHGDQKNIPELNRDPGDPEKDRFIKDHLDHQNGDAFLMIGEFNEERTEDVFRRSASEAKVPLAQLDALLQFLL